MLGRAFSHSSIISVFLDAYGVHEEKKEKRIMKAKDSKQEKGKREYTVIRNFSGERSPEQVLAELIKAHSEKGTKG